MGVFRGYQLDRSLDSSLPILFSCSVSIIQIFECSVLVSSKVLIPSVLQTRAAKNQRNCCLVPGLVLALVEVPSLVLALVVAPSLVLALVVAPSLL